MEIDPRACVDPAASIGAEVSIGPWAVVGPGVSLADGVRIHSHAVISGRTTIGPRTEVYPFASVGARPQDLKYNGESSALEIGADVTIREYVTINPGTRGGGMVTRIGDHVVLMIGVHVAHDCQIGERVVIANQCALAGHVVVEAHALIGGLCGVLQFVHIGTLAMIGFCSAIERDVPPCALAYGNRARIRGVNLVGMRRGELSREEIGQVERAYELYGEQDRLMSDRSSRIRALGSYGSRIADFIDSSMVRKTGLTGCAPETGSESAR